MDTEIASQTKEEKDWPNLFNLLMSKDHLRKACNMDFVNQLGLTV